MGAKALALLRHLDAACHSADELGQAACVSFSLKPTVVRLAQEIADLPPASQRHGLPLLGGPAVRRPLDHRVGFGRRPLLTSMTVPLW